MKYQVMVPAGDSHFLFADIKLVIISFPEKIRSRLLQQAAFNQSSSASLIFLIFRKIAAILLARIRS